MKLVEIIVALAILSLISLFSFSGYHIWYQKKQLSTSANQFITALNLAKQISILKNHPVYLCATQNQQSCNDQWRGEIIIFTSETPDKMDTIFAHFPALPANIHLKLTGFRKGAPYLYFMNNGEASNAGRLYFSNDYKELIFVVSKTGIVRQDISG